jgi:tRNA-specific 2-thiouridylase
MAKQSNPTQLVKLGNKRIIPTHKAVPKSRWQMYFKSSPLKLKKNHLKPTVFVAMSGGVDSSVTAYLLQKQGYQIVGVFMKNWSFNVKNIKDCPLYLDYLDMVKVCKFLKIPYLVFSFEKEYRSRVIDDFFQGYKEGITPNPDVLCNREIKFDLFLKKALKMGADLMATGHHIRLKCDKNGCNLLRGKDPIKDQTYFVYPLTQAQLKKNLFPIGEYVKADIRKIAAEAKLPTATKRDSQGICFIGRIDAKDFLKTKLAQKKGNIVDKNGKKLGEHEGAWFYTIGQRRIAGLAGTSKPMYVLATDVKKNLVIVGDDKDTYSKFARVKTLHIINPKSYPKSKLIGHKFLAKSRYTPTLSRGTLKQDKKGYYFEFGQLERAVTPGQSLVLFDKDICVGGGIINSDRK